MHSRAFSSGLLLFTLGLCAPVKGATFTVTNILDSGAGSLRQAIWDANTNAGPDTINFTIGSGAKTITPNTALPAITDPVTINGATQPGFTGVPFIELFGVGNKTFDGLVLNASNCTVRALVIGRFGNTTSARRSGILLTNFGGHVVVGCYLGTTADGTAANNNSQAGLQVIDSANNRIGGTNANEGNLISGNSVTGIEIIGAGSSGNTILNSRIGLDVFGTNAITVGSTGILISNAPNNTIGGSDAAARNVVAGNSSGNIRLLSSGATGNQIIGNWIGLRTDGQTLTASPSSGDGIHIFNAPSNTVGGTSEALRNVIGNTQRGLRIEGSNSIGNLIQGNFIGTSPFGTLSISNFTGIGISRADSNVIGGAVAGAGNLISGNRNYGIDLFDSSSTVIQGNRIGTDAAGMAALPNGIPGSGGGINIASFSRATNNQIGGLTVSARNLISGNNDGLIIALFGASNNVVQGNYIGVAADGVTAMGNRNRGIMNLGANSNLYGGGTPGAGNVIANNGLDGVWLAATFGAGGTPGTNSLVMGNQIYSNGVSVVMNGGYAAGVTLLGPNIISSNIFFGNIYQDIDRGGDGPTPNTPGGFANSPVVTSARQGSAKLVGYQDGSSHSTYVLQFDWVNGTPSLANLPIFLGSITVPTDAGGIGNFNVTFPTTAPVGATVGFTSFRLVPGSGESAERLMITVGPPIELNPPPYVSKEHVISSGSVGDPVSTFTGELYEQLPADLALDGPMPLIFARYYAAFLEKDALIAGKLGDNWLHNFEMTLTTTPSNTVNVVNQLGRLISFTNNSGSFTLIGRQDIAFQLGTNGGNYVLGDPRSQRLHTFDSSGKLISIADGHGNTHNLTYTGNLLTSVTDGLGRAFTLQYNGSGQLTNVTDGTRSVAFTQTGNNLASARSALGFVTTYTYDLGNTNSGLMTAATMPAGNQPFTQVFDAQGRVISQTSSGSNVWSLSFNGTTTTVTNPLGNIVEDVHTAFGELASYKDEAGQMLPIGSNSKGQRSLVTDRLGNSTGIAFHAPSGKPSALTNADGTITLFNYTPRTNSGIVFYDLSQVIYPDGASESFTYDSNGNLKTRTDRAGRIFGFSYNARGQTLTATNPLGGVVTLAYNANGRPATRTDSDTGITTYQYDSLNRLTNVIHPDSSTLRAAFDADDRLTSVTDERTNTTQFFYDANGRLTQIRDANGRTNQFSYDTRDRLVKTIDRLGQAASMSYDPLDHVAATTNRNGFVTRYDYDARQRLTAVTDPGNQNWRFDYDNEGLLTAAANPLSQTNRIGRDVLGYETSATNALGQSSRVVRDAMRRVTQSIDGILRTNSFAYDARGLLTNAAKPLIGSAGYERNALGQLSKLTGLNGEQWKFSHTPMGRLQSLADPLNRTNRLTYDTRGRLQRTIFADGTTGTNSYDAANNPTRQQFSAGLDLPFTYDALNRLTSTTNLALAYDAEGRVTNSQAANFNFGAAYDAGGRVTNVTYASGALTVTYTYDSRDRLTRVKDSLTTGQIDFTYDAAGRLTSATRANGVNGSYTYDAAGRLTRIQEGAIIDLQYGYNAAGEVITANFTAPLDPANFLAPANPSFGYDAAHQITNPGYSYDARGRLVASPSHAFAWDGASRLTQIDGVTLIYNGLNDLDRRTEGGVTTRLFYNYALGLAPTVAERIGGAFARYYVWTPGGRLLYLIDAANGNAVYYFHFDRVGSTLALTSGAGAVTDAYVYTPYGVLLGRTGTSPQPFTYVGAFGVRSEPAAKLFQMRARYYDPATTRFLTHDPVWPRVTEPLSLNPYNYAANNPLLYVDPVGLDEQPSSGGLSATTARIYERTYPLRIQLDELPSDDAPYTTTTKISGGLDNWGGWFPKPPKPVSLLIGLFSPVGLSPLFPFVTNQQGFDTGLDVGNTSKDPFGTNPRSGTGTPNYYGGNVQAAGGSPGRFPTISLPGNLQIPPFVSDAGAGKLAEGYLRLIVPETSPTPGFKFESLPNSSIEGTSTDDVF